MNWFLKFCQNVQIVIEIDKFDQMCRQQLFDFIEEAKARQEQLKYYSIDVQYIKHLLNQLQYPDSERILNAVLSNNTEHIFRVYFEFSDWSRSANLSREQKDMTFELTSHLRQHASKLQPFEYTEETAEQNYQQVMTKTKANMQRIQQNIQAAISRIPSWSTTMVRIIPSPSYDSILRQDNYTVPANSAYIELGSARWSPGFSYYENENQQIEIDDVLEGGEDFAEIAPNSPQLEFDYMMLIKELRNPGSTQKRGRKLRLYTARPVRDRQLYLNATHVPPGLFLTNSDAHAQGLAMDINDGGKRRDLWQITIDERYLIKTLDTVAVKYYQIIGSEPVPVHAIHLVDEGG